MKKQRLIFIMLVLILLGITACGKKAISSDEMASLFINKFIYNKDTTDFERHFVEGDVLGKQLDMMTDNFEKTFSDVFDSITDQLTNEEKEQLATNLMTKMKQESQYTYAVKKETKNKVNVAYTINGFDYAKLVESTLNNILTELTKEPQISKDDIPNELINSFDSSLNDVKAVDNSQEVTLSFEKVKNKWEIAENQDKQLEQILLSFVTGQSDKKSYEKKMAETVENVIKDASK